MNIIRDPDVVIDAWLADGPQRLPDGTRHAIAVGIRAVPRRRPTLQWSRSFFALSSAAVVVVVVALAFGIYVNRPGPDIGVQPTPTASPSPTSSPSALPSPPPALTSAFTSTVHGLSIEYPSTWGVRPATEAWTGGELSFDSPAADVIFDPALGDRLYLVLASQPYGGLSQDAWGDEVLAWTCPGGIRDFGSWTVDGAHAEHGGPCNSGVLVFEDTRGYFIRLVVASDEPALAETYNWDWLRPMLGTVDLRPDSALTSSFTSTVHGVSIEYPSTWEVRPATEAWNEGAFTFDAPGVDVIFDPTRQDDLYLSIVSAPLGDQSPEDWCCSEVWAAAEVCESGGNFGRITLDGAAAAIRGCDGVGNNFEDHVVQAATDTHGYVIYLRVAQDPALQGTYTEAWFDAVLETLDLP
jgi:hypothetical protein